MPWTVELPSGRYRAGYRASDGKTRYVKGTFAHKKDAERKAAVAEDAARTAGWRTPEEMERAWGEWVEHWWSSRAVEPATLRREASMRKHIDRRWYTTRLADINRQEVRAWAGELVKGGLQPSSVQRILNVFRSSLSAAVDAGVLLANPADRVRVKVGQKDVRRYLTQKEAKALLDALGDSELNRAIVSTLLYTGLRWGEVAGLQKRRVDLQRGVLRVAEVWDSNTYQMKAYPKGRRARDVPIPDHLASMLETRFALSPTEMVFSSPNEPIPDYSNWRKFVWLPTVAAAGLVGVKIHDLRHTYASWLLQAGVPLAEVGKLLGHADPSTTQIYAHLAETPRANVLAALPAV